MTTKILYIAEDGEEFDTSDECLKYEKKRDVHGAVIMFDSNRLPITDTDSITAFEDAEYLYILDAKRANEFFDFVGEDYGYIVPDKVVENGLYYIDYNRYDQTFDDLNDKIAELEVLRDELLDRARECITDMYKEGDSK